jgi:hypothetical protein
MKKQLVSTYSLLALSVPVALFATAPNAQAISVMRGSTATSSETTDFGSISNITNQSGLSSSYTSGVTDFDTYTSTTTHTAPTASNAWRFTTRSGIITFNLGASYTLEAIALWPFGTAANTAVRNFSLFADTDANTGNGLGTSLGTYTAIADALPTNAQVFGFGATSTQFIQMRITSNAGALGSTGFSEAAFAQAVPWETDALSVVGTTLLFAGGVWAKRKSVKPLDKE